MDGGHAACRVCCGLVNNFSAFRIQNVVSEEVILDDEVETADEPHGTSGRHGKDATGEMLGFDAGTLTGCKIVVCITEVAEKEPSFPMLSSLLSVGWREGYLLQ